DPIELPDSVAPKLELLSAEQVEFLESSDARPFAGSKKKTVKALEERTPEEVRDWVEAMQAVLTATRYDAGEDAPNIPLNTASPTFNQWRTLRPRSMDPPREPGPVSLGRYRYGGGPPTFGDLPLALYPEDLVAGKVDVAIVGAPLNMGSGWRDSGAQATTEMRLLSWPIGDHDQYVHVEARDVLNIVDYGDIAIDNDSTERSMRHVRDIVREIAETGAIPFIIGGDHSLEYPNVAALADVYGKERVSVIHFDSHYDAWWGSAHLISHGYPVYRLINEGHVRAADYIQVGLRSGGPDRDAFKWMREVGMRYHTMAEIERRGWAPVLERVVAEASEDGRKLHISFDIDVIDPAHTVGTGTPVPGGITMREAISVVRRLCAESNVVGFDLVELHPALDPTYATTLNSAHIVKACLTGIAMRKEGLNDEHYLSPVAVEHALDDYYGDQAEYLEATRLEDKQAEAKKQEAEAEADSYEHEQQGKLTVWRILPFDFPGSLPTMKITWAELRRRKVIRVAVAYVVSAWVLIQVGDTLFGMLELPTWTGKALIAVLVLGFPLALVLAWAFDVTPGGIVAADEAEDPSDAAAPETVKGKHFQFADLGDIDLDQLDLGRPQLTPLYGRDAECAIIAKRLDAAVAGHGGIVLIGGKPGEGKTRLGEEALEMGLARGMLPLLGQAYEEHGAPFIVSTEIIEDIQRALPADVLRNALGDTAPEIARLVPELRRALPDIPEAPELPPEQQQRFFFNAMLEFTSRLAKASPLVYLLDDLQWADESSTLLLEHVAPHLSRMPVLMVITYRDVAADIGEPFKRALAHLAHQDYVTRIRLRQLGREAVAQMLEGLAGSPAPEPVVDLIYGETEGNAFFAKSAYQHLAEEGRLFDAEGRWLENIDIGRLSVPEGVRLVIERRLERLDEATRKVLAMAAVIGLRFPLRMLEAALAEAEGGEFGDRVLDAVEQAEGGGLIFAAGDARAALYEFAHALVRQALLEQLSAPRRQRMHLQLANAMEALWGEDENRAADIALHLYRSGDLADPEKTTRFLVLAARRALSTAAADEAVDAFSKALELEQAPEQRARLLHERGVAYRTMGRWEDAARDWNEALPILENLDERELVARLYWELAYQHSWANEMRRAEELAERGLAFVGEEPSVARCQLLAAKGMNAGGRDDYDLWADSLDQAVAIAEQIGEERILGAEILQARMYLGEHWLRGRMHAETGDRAIEIVRRVGTPWDLSATIGPAMIGYLSNGRFDAIEALWREGLELALKYGDVGNEMHAKMLHALVLAYRGELDEARGFMLERADWARETGFAWWTIMVDFLAMTEFHRGDWDSARRLAADINEAPIAGTMAGIEPATEMLFLAYLGDREGALARMEQLGPRLAVAGRQNQLGSWIASISTLESAAMLGLHEACAELYPLPVQLDEDGTHVVWNKGLAQRHAAIAAAAGGRWEVAEGHFAKAEALARDAGMRLELAELTRWRAQMLLWRDGPGDREQARELAAEAGRAYRELRMPRHVALTEGMTVTSLSEPSA
ncbi:MAG: arginase family protein, partial [Gammaproteobacteria bacterium]